MIKCFVLGTERPIAKERRKKKLEEKYRRRKHLQRKKKRGVIQMHPQKMKCKKRKKIARTEKQNIGKANKDNSIEIKINRIKY